MPALPNAPRWLPSQLRLVCLPRRVLVGGQTVPPAVSAVAHLDGRVEDGVVGTVLPLGNVDVVALAGAHVQLTRAPDLDAARLEHLLPPVGEPSNAAGHSEQDRVEAGEN